MTIVGAVSPEPMMVSRRGAPADGSRSRPSWASSSSREATSSGCWAWRSWSAGGPNQCTRRVREHLERLLDGLALGRHAGTVAAVVGRHQQHRYAHAGVERPRVVLPEVAQDRQVALEGEPRRDGAVVEDLEVGQRGVDALVRPARMGHDAPDLQARERGRPMPAAAAGGRSRSQSPNVSCRRIHPPSTNATPCTGRSAASSSTTLPPHDWPATTGRSSPRPSRSRARSAAHGRDVVAVGRASPSARGLAGRRRRRGDRPRPAGQRRRPTGGRSRPARAPARTGGGCRPTGGRGGRRRRSQAPVRSASGYRSAAANSSSSSRLR